jgi:hypothetical protein
VIDSSAAMPSSVAVDSNDAALLISSYYRLHSGDAFRKVVPNSYFLIEKTVSLKKLISLINKYINLELKE